VKQYRSQIVKLAIFTLVSIVLTGIVYTTTINARLTPQTQYSALFADVSGLHPGDIVRIAGVEVGKVTDEQVVEPATAKVTFSVDSDQPVTTTTKVVVRYQNLLGQRFVALVAGDSPGKPLAAGTTIPESMTAPALDLTTLFNGFKPLFDALTPDDINKLAALIVLALQGESAALSDLIQQTASLTSNLADRDQIIGSVIDHLTSLLQPVRANDQQLAQTVGQLQQFASGLASDKDAILGSLQNIDSLAATLASVLQQSHPSIDHDIAGLRIAADTLVADEPQLNAAVQSLPGLLRVFVKILDYGSWANVYVCNLGATTNGGIPADAATAVGGPLGTLLGGLLPPSNTTIAIPQGALGNQGVHSAVCR
jgi:phospholipid/cholesterol/gamma-HCH transport system substrate-binding protein